MGQLVTFKKRERTTAPPPAGSTARILIFTGVRYERAGPAAPRDRDGSRRKRG